MNWLDIVLVIVIGVSVVDGLAKGLARAGLGFAAVILGLFGGLWFYGTVGSYLADYVSSRRLANLIGFFVIFLGIVLIGALLGRLLEKLFRLAHLSWLDRLLGGAFGFLRGVLVAAVIVLAMMAFAPKPPPRAVAHSRVAPYVIDAARVMAAAAPYEVKEGFRQSYDKIKRFWSDAVKKGTRMLPEEEI